MRSLGKFKVKICGLFALGVYFRKHTKEMADKLNLVGFVQNTSEGTVKGTVWIFFYFINL